MMPKGSYIQMNISLKGEHFFATSLRDEERAAHVYRTLKEKFPKSEGFHFICNRWDRKKGKPWKPAKIVTMTTFPWEPATYVAEAAKRDLSLRELFEELWEQYRKKHRLESQA